MFDRGVVHIVVAVILLTITVFDRGVVVDHYCLMFERSGSYCCGWLYC